MSAVTVKYNTCTLMKPKKTPVQENLCLTGFDHGKDKQEMNEEFASGPNGVHYGEGYRAGREFTFNQTGSKRRKTKKHARKIRRTRKVNGRK